MKIIPIPVEQREKCGSAEARRMRRAGRIPAILYGLDRPPLALSIETRRLAAEVNKGQRMFDLQLGDKTRVGLLKDLQYNALGDTILHADFNRVDDATPVSIVVPLEFIGHPSEVSGASLEHVSQDVTVRCLPRKIPTLISVHQSHLEVGDHIEAGQLELPEGVELDDTPTKTLVTFHYRHRPVEAGEAEEGEEGAEPEVLTERRSDDEGEGGKKEG